jgi:5-methyltetrahydrofolate corrinoid/iron sulfur protein methyltransferase
MLIDKLRIIGESINDSIPSTQKMFDAGDRAGLLELARSQDERGAAYIDVNVGRRSAEFMADMVRAVQAVTKKPLSIDTPDAALAAAGLKAYDPAVCGGQRPIINSISPLRVDMFGLHRVRPFMPLLMISERVENGASRPNHTVEDTFRTAQELMAQARAAMPGLQNDHCVIDPGIAPIASDAEGHLKRVLATMAMIHADPDFAGVHMSVGLSNFTVMLPSKRADGALVKSALESAFITKAMPLGLDMIIGSVKRKYEILPDSDPAMQCVNEVLTLEGFDAILRVKDFYS